jgi:hypothetical protein
MVEDRYQIPKVSKKVAYTFAYRPWNTTLVSLSYRLDQRRVEPRVELENRAVIGLKRIAGVC